MTVLGPDPEAGCRRCPRLAGFLDQWRAKEPLWHNGPVPRFGDWTSRLLIVGLAPGLRGANRTGRPFTGDYAGNLLYETLGRFGFAYGSYRADPQDGLQLVDCMIANSVRCVPPENKPTPAEINNCRPHLEATLRQMPRLSHVVALGRIAHEQLIRTLGLVPARYSFGHGARHQISAPRRLVIHDSFHCSRYNTNTGRLTAEMFHSVFAAVRGEIDHAGE
jgi:uracil-DNA glycosylase